MLTTSLPCSAGASHGLVTAGPATAQQSTVQQAADIASEVSDKRGSVVSPTQVPHAAMPAATVGSTRVVTAAQPSPAGQLAVDSCSDHSQPHRAEQPQPEFSSSMLAGGRTREQPLAHVYTEQLLQGQQQLSSVGMAKVAAVEANAAQQPEQLQPACTGFVLANGRRPKKLSSHAQIHARDVLEEEQKQLDTVGHNAVGSKSLASSKSPQPEQLESAVNAADELHAEQPLHACSVSGSGDKSVQTSAQGRAEHRALAQEVFSVADTEGAAPADDKAYDKAQHTEQSVCSGFMKGTGKPVQLSAQGQARAKLLLQEEQTDTADKAFESSLTLPLGTAQHAQQPLPAFVGFASGSGNKPVHVSAHGQACAMQLLQAEQTGKAESEATDNTAVPASTAQHAQQPQTNFVGFASGAGNKPVQISAHGQARAKHLFQQEPTGTANKDNPASPCSAAQHAEQPQAAFVGFVSGAGSKPVQLSAHGQARAKQLLQVEQTGEADLEATESRAVLLGTALHAEHPPAAFVGFASGAGNKPIQLSAHGQVRARQVLQVEQTGKADLEATDSRAVSVGTAQHAEQPQPAFVGFASGAGNKPVQLSAHAQARARQLLCADKELHELDSKAAQHADSTLKPAEHLQQPVSTGFKTGAGDKAVQITAAQQAHAKQLFDGQQMEAGGNIGSTHDPGSAADQVTAEQGHSDQWQQHTQAVRTQSDHHIRSMACGPSAAVNETCDDSSIPDAVSAHDTAQHQQRLHPSLSHAQSPRLRAAHQAGSQHLYKAGSQLMLSMPLSVQTSSSIGC